MGAKAWSVDLTAVSIVLVEKIRSSLNGAPDSAQLLNTNAAQFLPRLSGGSEDFMENVDRS